MKQKCYYLILSLITICFTINLLYAGAVIVNFKGEAGKNKVILKWSTISEVNCKEFKIERSLDKSKYQEVGSVKAAGNSSEKKDYEFEDKTVFRTTGNTFYYRLKIIDNDGSESTFSDIVSVTPSISGVRHTWGSIKALFR